MKASHAVSEDCSSYIQFNGDGSVLPNVALPRVILFSILLFRLTTADIFSPSLKSKIFEPQVYKITLALIGFYVSPYSFRRKPFDPNKNYFGAVILGVKNNNKWYSDGRSGAYQ